MGQVSTKAIVAGVAGALGVVATTQVPMVQAAVDQLATIATDSEHVATTHEASTVVDNDDKQVTTKSDVVRDKVLATAPKISLRAVANVAPVAPATDKVGDVELLANSEAEAPSSATAVYTPAESSAATSAAVTPAEQAVVSEAEATTEKPADTITYTIKDGDTLGQLAAQYGVSVADIQALNPDVDVTMLQIGQTVYIPSAGTVSAAPASVAASEAPSVASVAPSEAPTVAESSVVSQTSVASEAPAVSEASVAPVESSVVSEAPVIASEAPVETPATSVATSETSAAPSEAASVTSEVPASDYVNAPATVQGGLTASQRTAIVNAALKYAGQDIPYVWGGKTPAGFDCSGLAAWVFNDAGLSLPSYTVSEEAYVSTTDVKTPADVMATAQPGDLLFWGDHGSSWHVAIYIGNGQYVAAPAPGYNVRVENVTAGFMPAFVGSYNV
ncbi:peptidoglycan-binding protein [Weissella confusa]|uniref:C40 family peptidase n=1 Tax=Weissella confusa TaxID=1583 RepID=UPI001092ED7F|nr:C40 family peptidase [Weissella confusa]MBJ7694061.1 LysM peptidoglycan-binding domain-containing protein [Weissella confusa]QBZ04357.1 peptidoglycan-binding protein [Weissella confusa]